MRVIIITGTPGTGKTTISRKISKNINAEVISLNILALEEDYILGTDSERETSIIKQDKIIDHVLNLIQDRKQKSLNFLIIEGHFADIIPTHLIDQAIVLRCNPDELRRRLITRGYKKKKVMENIQSEILGNCVNFFINKHPEIPLLEIDTSQFEIDTVVEIITEIITESIDLRKYRVGKIDWLEKLSKEDRIFEFFDKT